MRRVLTIAVAVTLAGLIAGTAIAQMGQGPRGPMGPGQTPPQMGQMMEMMGRMQGMMTRQQEMMRQHCPGPMGGQAPGQGG
ncbi:MAG: hypothetical protein HYY19_06050 [Candidatus Rokubacteria bacterium]|nr:hypothetical protein [Candidatus Rokubacteria bacterium]